MVNRNILRRTLALLALFSLACPAFAQIRRPAREDAPPAGRNARLWNRALRLHRASIVVDGHNDVTTPMVDENYDLGVSSVGKYHTDIARMRQGGITGQFFAIYVDADYVKNGGSARRALDMIDMVYRAAERHPNEMVMATTAADILRAKRTGKIAALMGIEGGHAIENSLMALRNFYRLGVRYMTLTHNNTNDWADSSRDAPRHNGLSAFGEEVVREMNRLGMLIDVSHVSDETMSDALDISTAPIIASHSSARALADHPRNIPDVLLRRIGQKRGLVMVNFYPGFIDPKAVDASRARDERLKPEIDALRQKYAGGSPELYKELIKLYAAHPIPETPLSVLIDHIDHIARVAGVDHVGLGSDFDGVPSLPQEMQDVAQLPNITYELLKRGYKEADVRKILGGNLIRVMSEAERVASGQISDGGSVRRIK